ncbi:Bis(5'-adenosyl)-triphosphatase [Purpureocillium takamizusanense]|uniref:Bis(5'-adenosyl)-triphosphatase n=1 Tax=Purpureocillium takamizusanense TaxID=2060973 RepID=A0A9Q8QKT9_9HYPO|nr:Bis(5'-adenosyl)-triphosphatase [Purpureocillium takamizusanense]UNI21808.1 Bis(5'-adenosyl)-triphosphatase [Purpureocillium takamizusanense]
MLAARSLLLRTRAARAASSTSPTKNKSNCNTVLTAFRPVSSSVTRAIAMSSVPDVKEIRFGPFEVTKQVFCVTPLSFALVNLKPIVPGHVLVCPLAPHRRLTDLSPAETADLFTTVQLIQRVLAQNYFPTDENLEGRGQGGDPSSSSSSLSSLVGGSFTVAVQDGPDAGQTVPHVHVHVIPRAKGDLGDAMDEIYVRMAGEEGNVGGALWDGVMGRRPVPGGGMPRIEDVERNVRTERQMHDEADRYRATLRQMHDEGQKERGGGVSKTEAPKAAEL